MEASETMIAAVRNIVNPLLMKPDDENRLEDFYIHIAKQTFRPLPRQFKTLSVIGALERWSDLKSGVRQQLFDEIASTWLKFADTPENESENIVPVVKKANNNTSDQIKDTALDLTTAPSPKTDTGASNPYLRINTRRDWFDMVLDFVAALTSLLEKSEGANQSMAVSVKP